MNPTEAYLLDTVAASAFIRQNPDLLQALDPDSTVMMSIVSLGELRYGALKAGNPRRQMERVELLAQQVLLLDCTTRTAEHFATIRADLSRRGTPIPVNDIWIAATAMEWDVAVVSTDKHFDLIAGLTVIRW